MCLGKLPQEVESQSRSQGRQRDKTVYCLVIETEEDVQRVRGGQNWSKVKNKKQQIESN